MNAVLANTAIMTIRPVALTPYAAIRALVRRDAPSRRTRSSTAPCQSRTVRSMASRRFGDDRSSRASVVRSRAVPAALGPPRGRGALRRPFRGGVDEQGDARLQRRGELGARLGPAGDGRGEPVAQPPDPVLQRAQQLPGADELLPAGQDLTAQQRAVAHALVDLGDRALVGRVGVGPQPLRGVDLRPGLRGEPGGARPEAVERAVEGATDDRGAVRGVAGQVGEPVAERGDDRLGQQAVVQRRLGDDEQRRVAQAVRGEHLAAGARRCRPRRPGGTRSSSMASAVPRSCAVCRTSQGTASA